MSSIPVEIVIAVITFLSAGLVAYLQSRHTGRQTETAAKKAAQDAAREMFAALCNEQQERIEQLHRDIQAADAKIAALEGQLAAMREENAALRARLKALEEERAGLLAELAELKQRRR